MSFELVRATQVTAEVVATSAGYYTFPMAVDLCWVSVEAGANTYFTLNRVETDAASATFGDFDFVLADGTYHHEITDNGRISIASLSVYVIAGGTADKTTIVGRVAHNK